MGAVRRGVGTVLAVAGAAGAAHVARFYAGLSPRTGEAESLLARTDDGWDVALARYAAAGRPKGVVVAGHGFAGSRLIWDVLPEVSLARHLARAGYDVYAVDLRGRGSSWPPGPPAARAALQWSFDDVVFRDLPAAVDAACERSGFETAFWLGQEMSGQALYAAAISATSPRLAGGVTLGSPAVTPPEAKVPGVTAPPKARAGNRVPFRSGAHHAGPVLALLRSRQLESSFVPANVDPRVPARYLRHGVPDESTALADQFADWVTNATMRSLDHSTVWSDRLAEFRLPVLVMAAARDRQRPARAVRATFDALGSDDKTFVEAGTAGGMSVDYGHDDLVAARSSPAEVFPRISGWLDDRA